MIFKPSTDQLEAAGIQVNGNQGAQASSNGNTTQAWYGGCYIYSFYVGYTCSPYVYYGSVQIVYQSYYVYGPYYYGYWW